MYVIAERAGDGQTPLYESVAWPQTGLKLEYYILVSVVQDSVPDDALLKTYRGSARPERWNHHVDCFTVTVDRSVRLSDFVIAFYTSRLFRVERLLLTIVFRAPSTDAQVHAVAEGSTNSFAIWRVGERTSTQLLMCDRYEKTRSWFRVVPNDNGRTVLQFGSAVAARRDRRTGSMQLRTGFRVLLPFHVLYSKLLLKAATNRVMSFSGHLD